MKTFKISKGRIGVITALWSLFALTSCGGGSGADGHSGLEPKLNEKGLSVSAPGQVVAYAKARLQKRSPAAWTAVALQATPSATAASTDAAVFSNSILQEQGVDEDDLIKTDGTTIYSLANRLGADNSYGAKQLQSHNRLTDGTISLVSSVTLDASKNAKGLYLLSSIKRIAIVGQGYELQTSAASQPLNALIATSLSPFYNNGSSVFTSITVFDVSAPSQIKKQTELALSGAIVGTRVIGDLLYVVSTYSPKLAVDNLPTTATTAQRDAAIANITATDLLPTIRVDGQSPSPLVTESDCYVQDKNASTAISFTTITAINLASSTLDRTSRCIAGGSEAIYMSANTLYVASTRFDYGQPATAGISAGTGIANSIGVYPLAIQTDIHKFSIETAQSQYKGTGTVDGHLGWDSDKKAYRMSEHQGDLRVISFTGQTGWFGSPAANDSAGKIASPALLTVLREVPGNPTLKQIATLPNSTRPPPIGLPNEQIYAVRFVGDKAYVVTFRTVDPLYVLDLSVAADPKVVGELKIDGFSDYLIPLSPSLLLGVGKDATSEGLIRGVKIGLIDVSNPAKPTQLATKAIGERGSESTLFASPRGINVLTTGNVVRITLPVRVNETPSANRFWYEPSYQALFRFEVNLDTKTFAEKTKVLGAEFTPSNASGAYDGPASVANDRSVQIGEFSYYLTGGALKAARWQ